MTNVYRRRKEGGGEKKRHLQLEKKMIKRRFLNDSLISKST